VWVRSPCRAARRTCASLSAGPDARGIRDPGASVSVSGSSRARFDPRVSHGQRLARFETLDNEREVARELEDLKKREATNLASTILAAQAPVLSKVKDYLCAASEVARTESNAAPKAGVRLRASGLPQAIMEAVGRLAAECALEPNILGQWTAAVLNAVHDKADALHPFATAALTNESLIEKTNVQSSEAGLPAGARIVVDFGKLAGDEWFADGVGFGLRPVRPGE